MDDTLFTIRPDKPGGLLPDPVEEIYFGMGVGEFYEIDYPEKNRDKICAKSVRRSTKMTLYIRLDKEGRLFNPLGYYAGRLNKNEEIRYVRVNKQCFEMYCKFLSTQNKIYLVTAERMSL